MASGTLTDRVTAEIEALHAEFEHWFAGLSDDFERIRNSMAEDFTFISAGGDILQRDDLLSSLHAARGSRRIRIHIADVVVRWDNNSAILATYEEWQELADYTAARRSTVLFTLDDAAPGGFLWRHVHETWKVPPPDES